MRQKSLRTVLFFALVIGFCLQAERCFSNGQAQRALKAMSSAVWGT